MKNLVAWNRGIGTYIGRYKQSFYKYIYIYIYNIDTFRKPKGSSRNMKKIFTTSKRQRVKKLLTRYRIVVKLFKYILKHLNHNISDTYLKIFLQFHHQIKVYLSYVYSNFFLNQSEKPKKNLFDLALFNFYQFETKFKNLYWNWARNFIMAWGKMAWRPVSICQILLLPHQWS